MEMCCQGVPYRCLAKRALIDTFCRNLIKRSREETSYRDLVQRSCQDASCGDLVQGHCIEICCRDLAKRSLTLYMMVDQNSFIRKRPFFANKNVTFAKLSRTPSLSIAGPMLGNNASYEDSFTTCQITPENHGSLLDSLFKHANSITESLLRTDCC